MDAGRVHPEVRDMLYGMKAGHLPAQAEDVRKLEDTLTLSSPQECQNQHPEYLEYCHYARSLGYSCKC